MSAPVLEIDDLTVRFDTPDGPVHAVNGISIELNRAEILGVVGESGSGKSQLWLAVMGLLARNGKATGRVSLDGEDILGLSASKLNKLRGARLAMIFQDPMTALNPYLSIGRQMTEVLTCHLGIRKRDAVRRCIEALKAVHITAAESRLDMYPHEFSGGMRQRVMIAMALLGNPEVLIADEPTTALDVTVQAQILALLDELRERFDTAVVLVTHDLGVIAQIADRVAVLYGGRLLEQAESRELFRHYCHPYTEGLLNSVPRLDKARTDRLVAIPGNPPDLARMPSGCPFSPRCSYASEQCRKTMPPLERAGEGHICACFNREQVACAPGEKV